MRARYFITGGLLFAAGFLLGQWWQPLQTTPDGNLQSRKAQNTPATVTPAFSSIKEAIRLAPELVLEDLANDPYLTLMDAEEQLLAAAVDVTKERHRRLVDRVTPPDFSTKLWQAVMRANVGKMPLEELVAHIKDARTRSSDHYRPIAEAIHASPDRKEILTSDWGKPFLIDYLDRFAGEIPNLKDAFALIPDDMVEPQVREELVISWMYARPTAANMEAVFQLASSEPMRAESARQNAAAIAWKKAPAERQEILAKVTALPGQQRNWILRTLASATPPDDPAALAGVLSQFTSFAYQSQAAARWLKNQDEGGKQKLIAELDAMKDNSSVRKLRAKLAEN